VLALFAATSLVAFGTALWPHPGRGIIGLGNQKDPEIFVWAFAWFPHAIGTWTNPFITHAVYQPDGANVLWTTTTPGLALAFTPLTLLFGPVASFNVAALLMPALAAWTAYLLCRHLTGSTWASIVGGYIFGFSSYVVGHQYAGHLHTTSVFLIPLVALVVLRYLQGELERWGLVWRLGLLVAFELTISTEVLLTMTLAFALGLVLGLALAPERRRRIVSALLPIVAAYAFAAVLTAPFIVYILDGFESGSFVDVGFFNGDLLNIVLPTRLIGLGGSTLQSLTSHFRGNDNERDLYLGIPTLLMLALYAVRRRRSTGARFLVGSLLVAWILALGSALRVDGHRVVALPWSLVDSWPGLDNVITPRLAVYAALAASCGVAIWIATTRGRIFARPVILPALALVTIVPASWRLDFSAEPLRPEFFAHSLYRLCIPKGETLAVFPFGRWGDSMVWQAESAFWFKMAEGNLGRDTYPKHFVFGDPTVAKMQFDWATGMRPTLRELVGYVKSHGVDRVISTEPGGFPTGTAMHTFGPLQSLGDALIAPACGYDSLTGDRRRIPGQ
jgi:hypothetical protein